MAPSSGELGTLAQRRRFAALLSSVSWFAGSKAWLLASEHGSEWLLGFLVDACVVAGFWLCCELFAGRLGPRRTLASALYYAGLLATLGLVFAHTWFFDAAVERRLTLFDVTFAGIEEFFVEALPASGRQVMAAGCAGLVIGALLLARFVRVPSLRWSGGIILAMSIATGAWAMRAPRVPSVLYDSALELVQLARLPKLQPERGPEAQALAAQLVGKEGPAPGHDSPFRKVIVLVMETMTTRSFEAEARSVPEDSFVRAQRPHAHRYSRYFPNNQDSRTGMLNMLFSRLIPYEAYSARGLAGYERLPARPSLVDRFKSLGYRSAFAVSQVALEEVVSELHWDAFLHWSEPEIERAQQAGFLCLAPDVYENGCEDQALLPKLLDFAAQHERAFVYQEFIWGHSPEYNQRKQQSNTQYYSAYLDALLAGLRARGLLDETLIVLTSDHGFRDKSLQTERWVYHIPLWFYATRFQGREDSGLFSHADLGALLASEMQEREPALEAHSLMVVGPTGNATVAMLDPAEEMLLWRARGPFQLLVKAENLQSGKPVQLRPSLALGAFEAYRAQFDAWLAASSP